MLEKILNLYRKYFTDLTKAREFVRKEYNDPNKSWWPQYDDLEAEISYLMIREAKPKTVIEISPCRGYSSMWILKSLKDNGSGELTSFDLHDFAKYNVPEEFFDIWDLIVGDATKEKYPDPDYLFIDSEHTLEFANWYIERFLEKLKGIPVSVHDVFHTADPNGFSLEGGRIVDWLGEKGIEYITASPNRSRETYEAIMELKKELGLDEPIHSCINNPCIFFKL